MLLKLAALSKAKPHLVHELVDFHMQRHSHGLPGGPETSCTHRHLMVFGFFQYCLFKVHYVLGATKELLPLH